MGSENLRKALREYLVDYLKHLKGSDTQLNFDDIEEWIDNEIDNLTSSILEKFNG